MANVGTISAAMELDATQFGSELAHVKTEVRTFGHDVDRVGSMVKGFLGGFAAYRVGGFIVDIAKQAASAEEAVNGLAVVFGSRAGAMEDYARGMADQFKISINEMLGAESRIGSIFQGAGLGESKVAAFSQQIASLAVDYSRLKNVSIGESFEKMLSGLAGEAEPLRAFGIFLSDAAIKAKALQMGIGGLNGELTEGEKIQARFAFIMDRGRVAIGTAAREADGAAAKIDGLSASWENFKVSLGGVAAPPIAAAFGALSSWLDQLRGGVEWLKGANPGAAIGGAIEANRAGLAALQTLADASLAADEAARARKLPPIKEVLKGGVAMDPEALGYKGKTGGGGSDFAAAAMRGSAEAASTIFRTKFGGGGNKAAEQTAANTKQVAVNTNKLISGVSVMTGKLEALTSSAAPDWR